MRGPGCPMSGLLVQLFFVVGSVLLLLVRVIIVRVPYVFLYFYIPVFILITVSADAGNYLSFRCVNYLSCLPQVPWVTGTSIPFVVYDFSIIPWSTGPSPLCILILRQLCTPVLLLCTCRFIRSVGSQ